MRCAATYAETLLKEKQKVCLWVVKKMRDLRSVETKKPAQGRFLKYGGGARFEPLYEQK